MSHYRIKNSSLQGEITIPPSKSHTLRAILFGAMGEGKSVIRNPLFSPDTTAMMEACRHFGAEIKVFENRLEIQGLNGKIAHVEDVIQAGNSGIVLRFISALGTLGPEEFVVTGDYSLRHRRPMRPLLEGLTQLGVSARSMRRDGFAPVILQGPLKPGRALIQGEDSQPVSALLMAAAFVEGSTWIEVQNPGEKAWVALTLQWFKRLGIACENRDFHTFSLQGGARYRGFDYTVPGDFSSAAFPIAAALLTGSELLLKNLDMQDSQGDKALIPLLQKMGAIFEIEEASQTVRVRKGGGLKGVEVDINNFIDSITILAVIACFADSRTRIYHAAVARHKECDRISSIATELRKMGAELEETADGLIIYPSTLKGTELLSYQDHRMGMSLAVAALAAKGDSVIHSVDCVAKTFPTFVDDFKTLGAHIEAHP